MSEGGTYLSEISFACSSDKSISATLLYHLRTSSQGDQLDLVAEEMIGRKSSESDPPAEDSGTVSSQI